ncbi:rab11 family-interacting protein 4-like [Saccoglossus kowalevskii]
MDIQQDLDKQLKAVFDAFDPKQRGYISTEHFVGLAVQYTNKQQIDELLLHLDVTNSGKINFTDFSHGVKTILQDSQGVDDSSYYSNSLSEDLGTWDDDSISCGTYETSESTYNEYDEMNDDSVMTDATDEDAITLLTTDDTDSALTPSPTSSTMNTLTYTRKKPRNDHPLILTVRSSSDDEEQFVDYGEGDDMDGDDSDTDIPDYLSDSNRQTPTTPTPMQTLSLSFDNRKTITQKRDVWGRVRQLSCSKCKARLYVGPVRRLTTREIASHLYKNSVSANNSKHNSLEDIYGETAASDGDVTDLNDKVTKLQSQVNCLQAYKASKDDLHSKLKNENAFLNEKIRFYEEQLNDTERKSQETVDRERRKNRETMVIIGNILQNNYFVVLIFLISRISALEEEVSKLKTDQPRLKSDIDRLNEDNQRLHVEILDKDADVQRISHEYKRYQEQWRTERRAMREDIESNATENIALKETNEELNAQIIHNSLQLGKQLLGVSVCKSDSFAAEIETASKDEIMAALKEEEQMNRDLKEYIDRILVRIIENNPSLLEINPCGSPR